MPSTFYLASTYPTDLDPATADIWAALLNALFIAQDAAHGRVCVGGTILSPIAKDYTILPYIRFPGTIQKVAYWTDAGTVTVNTKINSAAVTNGNVSATSSVGTNSPTAADAFVATDSLKVSLSTVSGVGELYYALWLDRSGAGTA